MKNSWLIFLSISFLTIVTFVFFFLNTQPIELPKIDPDKQETLTQPVITFVNPSKGPTSAPVTIVLFGDFQCQACAEMSETIETIRQAYPDNIRVIWKNFPNESLHPEATPSAIAAHCADRQGKFWQYHDQLFTRQSVLSKNTYDEIAKDLALDINRFENCIQSEDTLAIVQKDFEEARALQLSATPATYVGTQLFVGAITLNDLTNLVKTQLP